MNVSPGGIPKRPVSAGFATATGIQGDSWANRRYHGGPQQAILLMASEVLDGLKGDGYPVFFGALGENITVSGLDPRQWRPGQIFRAGTARIELTKIRVPCSKLDIYGASIKKAIFDPKVRAGDTTSPLWGFSGFYAAVLTNGVVLPGSKIELESIKV